jgi:hypothetical protein
LFPVRAARSPPCHEGPASLAAASGVRRPTAVTVLIIAAILVVATLVYVLALAPR